MEPYDIAYYLELQRQLSDAKGFWQEPLVGDPEEMNFEGPHASPSKRNKVAGYRYSLGDSLVCGTGDIRVSLLSVPRFLT